MRKLKKAYLLTTLVVCISLFFSSCESDDSNDDGPKISNELITLDSYVVDFGEVSKASKASKNGADKTVVLTLTNNSDEVLKSLGSSIEFEGNAGVDLNFSPVEPGGSIEVPFTYSPSSGAEPGEYKGKATLTPSIGVPIEVELKVTVIE